MRLENEEWVDVSEEHSSTAPADAPLEHAGLFKEGDRAAKTTLNALEQHVALVVLLLRKGHTQVEVPPVATLRHPHAPLAVKEAAKVVTELFALSPILGVL